jgi:hypothetical protein
MRGTQSAAIKVLRGIPSMAPEGAGPAG